MKKQLDNIAQAVGKTIEAGKLVNNGFDNQLYISFTDNTFIAFQAVKEEFGEGAELQDGEACDLGAAYGCNDASVLIELGILTQEEQDDRRLKQEANWAIEQERNERAKYEKLKAKFEGGVQTLKEGVGTPLAVPKCGKHGCTADGIHRVHGSLTYRSCDEHLAEITAAVEREDRPSTERPDPENFM